MNNRLVVANWKMHTTLSEAMILANGVKKADVVYHNLTVVLCPPFPFIVPVAEALASRTSHLFVGAQNIFWQEQGPYTGEVAASMLRGLADYVILGHSERRRVFDETNKEINLKIRRALEANLRPIVCVGERRPPKPSALVDPHQLESHHLQPLLDDCHEVVRGLRPAEMAKVIIAYEPVWAISTNKQAAPATGVYANWVIEILRQELDGMVPREDIRIPILYGGSVTAANALEFARMPEIDGCLVGGASLRLKDFLTICKGFGS